MSTSGYMNPTNTRLPHISDIMSTSGYTDPANARLPPISVTQSPAGNATSAASRNRKCSIAQILNPAVPAISHIHELSASVDNSGIRSKSGAELCAPSSSHGDPMILDPPSSSSNAPAPPTTIQPFMVVILPAPGLTPRDARHLTNLNLALSTHAVRRNYERLHDALLCLDYALKRAPYTNTAIYQPLLDAWMRYKDRYLEYESEMIRLRLIPEPYWYTVLRNRVLVRNVWAGWVPGVLVGRGEGEMRGPGGKRVEMDVVVGRALANMVFPVEVRRGG
ncbi:hypothetical protein P167DRAFT_588484 [Morchella conica CCBAS932]|uniref:Uncharacterized protein n=1 Tax=Morchella conica CCBAS932 TaxID=1392247 RepID=A0A3N4KP48_9PEZI|nr:hypothetical protein P167DRAFT_588484 [Morchella conica CCBAS932]